MFRSEEPWAIANTLTPPPPRAVNTRAAMPGRARHALAHHGHHAHARARADAVDEAGSDLVLEGAAQGVHRPRRVLLGAA